MLSEVVRLGLRILLGLQLRVVLYLMLLLLLLLRLVISELIRGPGRLTRLTGL